MKYCITILLKSITLATVYQLRALLFVNFLRLQKLYKPLTVCRISLYVYKIIFTKYNLKTDKTLRAFSKNLFLYGVKIIYSSQNISYNEFLSNL